MSRPNIVLLCADEMKASALGCYGQRIDVSPTIDAWSARALRVSQCHTVHTKCVPSRVALVTGMYPHVGGHRTLQMPVRPDEPHLLDELRASGYRLVLAGKNDTFDDALLPAVFDEVLVSPHTRELEPPIGSDLPLGAFHVGRDPRALEEYVDHDQTTMALDWLARRRDRDPFFLWVNWECPHPPYGVPAPYHGRIDRGRLAVPAAPSGHPRPRFHDQLTQAYELGRMTDAHWREVIATYLEMSMLVDDQVQRVLAALDDGGLRQDTVVVFLSDHGDFAGEQRLVEKWDTAFYDCITRVPLVIDAPRTSLGPVDLLCESVDVFPTLLQLCGVGVPGGLHGRSLLPVLQGQQAPRAVVQAQGGQEPALLEHASALDARSRPCAAYLLKQQALLADPQANLRARMLRTRDVKYVARLGDGEQLFDLRRDPGELDDLSQSPAAADLLHACRRRMIDVLLASDPSRPLQEWLDA